MGCNFDKLVIGKVRGAFSGFPKIDPLNTCFPILFLSKALEEEEEDLQDDNTLTYQYCTSSIIMKQCHQPKRDVQ